MRKMANEVNKLDNLPVIGEQERRIALAIRHSFADALSGNGDAKQQISEKCAALIELKKATLYRWLNLQWFEKTPVTAEDIEVSRRRRSLLSHTDFIQIAAEALLDRQISNNDRESLITELKAIADIILTIPCGYKLREGIWLYRNIGLVNSLPKILEEYINNLIGELSYQDFLAIARVLGNDSPTIFKAAKRLKNINIMDYREIMLDMVPDRKSVV